MVQSIIGTTQIHFRFRIRGIQSVILVRVDHQLLSVDPYRSFQLEIRGPTLRRNSYFTVVNEKTYWYLSGYRR